MDIPVIPVFLLNVFLNSLLIFFTAMLIAEGFIWLFRIKNERLRIFCRFLPLLKLGFDLFRYNFSTWAVAQGLNPLLFGQGTRNLVFNLQYGTNNPIPYLPLLTSDIHFCTINGHQFTLADMLILSMDSSWILVLTSLFVVGSCFFLMMGLWQALHSLRWVRKICKSSSSCQRPIMNLHLHKKLYQLRVKLAVSNECTSPFSAGIFKRWVIFPEKLLPSLSQNEFEAILSHELEHLSWFDPLVKLILHSFKCIFWWVPLKRWLKKMEYDQEQFCDRQCYRYNIQRTDLATAIQKTLRFARPNEQLAATHFVGKYKTLKRIKTLLTPEVKPTSLAFKLIQGTVFSLLMSVLLFGRMWIF